MTWKRPTAPGSRLVAGVAADALVAARAERVGALAGQDDHADARVLARARERVAELDDRLRAEGVADLRPVDRDLRDAGLARALVADVRVLAVSDPFPGHGAAPAISRGLR